MNQTIFVGESNPYGADPEFALYPLPEHSAGGRLCTLVLGMNRGQYLRAFDRANLCPGRWSMPSARVHAEVLVEKYLNIVMLGAKVTRAFEFEYRPFTNYGGSPTFVCLPHPSGLCRAWSEPGAFERARAVLREAGVL